MRGTCGAPVGCQSGIFLSPALFLCYIRHMDERILIRGVNWVGDSIMMLPALWSVKKAFPRALLSLLVKPSVAPLLEHDPHIDEILIYGEEFKGLTGRIRLARFLRKRGFSKAILFQNAFDAALIAFLAGIPERIGYKRDWRGPLLTNAVPFHNEDRELHHTEYYLNMLRASGMPSAYSRPWIYLFLEERLSARQRLSPLRRPILGINPGSAFGPAKRWFPGRFGAIAERFLYDTGGSVVLFGGKGEEEVAEQVLESISRESRSCAQVLNIAGSTTLRDLVSLISECDLFVSNDSGPMHLSYAVGTPLVAIFGSTNPGLTGYEGCGAAVIKSNVPCNPCFERECRKGDLKCMEEIAPDDVYTRMKDVMSTRKAVFFDRDGTLCRDSGYLRDWNNFQVLPEVKSINILKNKGYLLIGISNQSGIRRGLVNESFVEEVNRFFIDTYGFDDFFYCPHGPDDYCMCRKPEPGMVVMARERYMIDSRKSYMVGDKDIDMLLAKAVGAKGIFVKTGHQGISAYADYVATGLREAVYHIMKDGFGDP